MSSFFNDKSDSDDDEVQGVYMVDSSSKLVLYNE